VTSSWNIGGLLRDMAARGHHPAVIAFGEDGVATWDSATLADKALRLAGGLRDAGIGRGDRVALGGQLSDLDRRGGRGSDGRRGRSADR
jgi:acyl-CoA synthetase (AMP-forming)/AMP-acid ligase II